MIFTSISKLSNAILLYQRETIRLRLHMSCVISSDLSISNSMKTNSRTETYLVHKIIHDIWPPRCRATLSTRTTTTKKPPTYFIRTKSGRNIPCHSIVRPLTPHNTRRFIQHLSRQIHTNSVSFAIEYGNRMALPCCCCCCCVCTVAWLVKLFSPAIFLRYCCFTSRKVFVLVAAFHSGGHSLHAIA